MHLVTSLAGDMAIVERLLGTFGVDIGPKVTPEVAFCKIVPGMQANTLAAEQHPAAQMYVLVS
jgi:hypothetical protein